MADSGPRQSVPTPAAVVAALETPLAPLSELPARLGTPAIVCAHGDLHARLAVLPQLRAALIRGERPPPGWPQGVLREALFETLDRLDLPAFCAGQPELADRVLLSLLFHADRTIDEPAGIGDEEAAARAAGRFAADWAQMVEEVREWRWVFDALGDVAKAMRWNEARGLLKSAGWQDLLRIRRLLERLEPLSVAIRKLGRALLTDEPDPDSAPVLPQYESAVEYRRQWREISVPEVAGETCGLERSARVARMLPGEAQLLGHPRLRKLWFARFAERTLLTYRERNRAREHVVVEVAVLKPLPQPLPERRMERGPIVVCVDTSGSMQGAAGEVAKAAVLEAMRVAHAQQRPCYVYAFSGPEDIAERELPLSVEGVEALLDFLAQSFSGGTDIAGPLARALDRMDDAQWRLADMLIASDGEFGLPRPLVERLAQAKRASGLRIQGVLIGDRETPAMRELCDELLWVRDWRSYGPAAVSRSAAPAEARSLTAKYFPGALK